MTVGGKLIDDDNPTSAEMQANEELRMFEHFLEYAALPVVMSTIESRSPPLPDIFCQLTSGEHVAFELGELSDQEFRKGGSTMMQFRELLHGLFQKLPAPVRAIIETRYMACRIDVSFLPEISLRRHEVAIGAFYRWLADQERFIGVLSADRLPQDVRSAIPKISISDLSPALWIEPAFGMWVSEPDLSVFKRKLGKTYDTTHPIELLLHSTWPLGDGWFARHADTLREGVAAGPFRRVWVFSPTERAYLNPVRFVYPTLDGGVRAQTAIIG